MKPQQKDALKWLIYKHISSSDNIIGRLLLKRSSKANYDGLTNDEQSTIQKLYEKESKARIIILDSSRIPHLRQIQSLLNQWTVA